MKFVNRLLRRVGLVLLPGPAPCGQTFEHSSNVIEHYWNRFEENPPSMDRSVRWMRRASEWVDRY